MQRIYIPRTFSKTFRARNKKNFQMIKIVRKCTEVTNRFSLRYRCHCNEHRHLFIRWSIVTIIKMKDAIKL